MRLVTKDSAHLSLSGFRELWYCMLTDHKRPVLDMGVVSAALSTTSFLQSSYISLRTDDQNARGRSCRDDVNGFILQTFHDSQMKLQSQLLIDVSNSKWSLLLRPGSTSIKNCGQLCQIWKAFTDQFPSTSVGRSFLNVFQDDDVVLLFKVSLQPQHCAEANHKDQAGSHSLQSSQAHWHTRFILQVILLLIMLTFITSLISFSPVQCPHSLSFPIQ